MMMKWIATACIVCLVHFLGNAATYYVATNGNNAADGSAETPWLNVWKAASTATAGDTVIIGAGEFNEFVTNTVSGTAGNPITFTGTRGSAGEWLTIIDPSVPYTNGWVLSPYGNGVYMQTNMPFTVAEMTINDQRVFFAYTNGPIAGIASGWTTTNTTGADLLILPSDAVLTNNFTTTRLPWWDSVKALYCSTGSVCYLRLKDMENPNGMNIRCAQNGNDYGDMICPAIKINTKHYITWKNVLIRGAKGGLWMDWANNNIIESNYISGGGQRVFIGTECYSNTVRYNEITANLYGYDDPGAHGTQLTNSIYGHRANLYCISKYLMSVDQNTFDDGIVLNNSSSNNLVYGNHIFKSAGEHILVYAVGSNYRMSHTQICNNHLENSSDVGILVSTGNDDTRIWGNHISDCNINFRCHHMDYTDTNRLVYFFRNTAWLPTSVGNHFYFHYGNSSPDDYFPTFWFYHNSFSGGDSAIRVSTYVVGSGGITNCHFINNIMSSTPYIEGESFGSTYYEFWTNAAMVGTFDYNLVTPPVIVYPSTNNPAWFGTNNIQQQAVEWTSDEAMSFELVNSSAAIGAAIDVTQPFTLDGINYTALPATETQKLGSAWDMGALEYGAGSVLRVGTLFSAPK